MWCWRKMLGVSWWDHRTNKFIPEELDIEREMAKVVKLKLQYFGHVARGSAGQLALTVLEWKEHVFKANQEDNGSTT